MAGDLVMHSRAVRSEEEAHAQLNRVIRNNPGIRTAYINTELIIAEIMTSGPPDALLAQWLTDELYQSS